MTRVDAPMSRPTNPFYGDIARSYDDWYATPWGAFADAHQRRLLLRLARPQPGERLLDVGCGTGRYLAWLAQMGLDCFGADISPDMLAVARQRLQAAGLPARLAIADAHHLPFASDSFDIAIAVTTLEFVEDPQRVVCEMARVARRIFLGVLNRRSRLFVQQTRRRGPLSAAHWFDPDELLSIVRSALPGWRLRVSSCLLFGRFKSAPGRWAAAALEPLTCLASLRGGFIGLAATKP